MWRRIVLEDSIVLLIESGQLVEPATKGSDKDFVFAAFKHVIYNVATLAVLFVAIAHNGSVCQFSVTPFAEQYSRCCSQPDVALVIYTDVLDS